MQTLLKIIQEISIVPSFSSYEDRIHELLFRLLEPVPGCEISMVPDHNVVVRVPGNGDGPLVALSAHLDKINHFGQEYPENLPFRHEEDRLTGQLDDSVGLGLCIRLAQLASSHRFPPLLLLFSEMEESFGLKNHPHLLKNEGEGLTHGMGAVRIARYLRQSGIIPEAVITLDTTPLFKGKPGAALYSGHWEFTGQEPSPKERENTERVKKEFVELDPDLLLSNNTNDYLHYGAELNRDRNAGVASIALEPAIFPYHQKNESVFIADIERVYKLMIHWLETG